MERSRGLLSPASDPEITIRKDDDDGKRSSRGSKQERSRNRQAVGDGAGDGQRAILPSSQPRLTGPDARPKAAGGRRAVARRTRAISSRAGRRDVERRHVCRTSEGRPAAAVRMENRQGGRRSASTAHRAGKASRRLGRNRSGPMRRASRRPAPPGAAVGVLGQHHRDRAAQHDRPMPRRFAKPARAGAAARWSPAPEDGTVTRADGRQEWGRRQRRPLFYQLNKIKILKNL